MINTVRNSTNQLLQKAKKSKLDEFYTQFSDIERELQYYQNAFKGKVVYCNCDDPNTSNFYKYFFKNFQSLGLKKLFASSYQNNSNGFYCEYSGELDKNGNLKHPQINQFEGDGDFRSEESTNILKQSDIIVSNPPFSLFREYVAQLVRYEKKFLIIGNVNAITYKDIFNLIQRNEAWLGVNLGRGISGFIVPEHYELYGTEAVINSEGQRIIATNNCLWLTNLEQPLRHTNINLTQEYLGNEEKYPKFDNCDAININKTKDIPKDYNGLMGVPITFLHKYNPDQFEIIRFRKGDDNQDLRINGKPPYFRILVRRR